MPNANGTISLPIASPPTVHQATNAAQSLGLTADGRTANGIDLVVAGRVELHDDGATYKVAPPKTPISIWSRTTAGAPATIP